MKLFKTAVASFLVMGALAFSMPTPASAAWHHDRWHHDNGRHEYRFDRKSGYDRGYGRDYAWHRDHPYADGRYAYGNHYNNYNNYNNGFYNRPGHQVLPANGEGMINKRNPNLIWACDGSGSHCHWARR